MNQEPKQFEPTSAASSADENLYLEELLQNCEATLTTDKLDLEVSYVVDLIRILHPRVGGVRRWAVMQSIRKNRAKFRRPIPDKFEEGVERAFRQYCERSRPFKEKRRTAPKTILFSCPQGMGSEVWAVYPDKAEAWLKDPTRGASESKVDATAPDFEETP